MSTETDELAQMLTRLKLTAIRDQLDALLDEAARRQMSLRETVVFLCEAEVARKDERRVHMAQSLAKFPYLRTLDDFEFDAQPSLDPRQIRDLATCRWIANGDALLVQGPPGVGKTHLAVGLGREAIRRGYSVLFISASALVTVLSKAQVDGRLEERLIRFPREQADAKCFSQVCSAS